MAQTMDCQVSIVVPMYNEQGQLALLIEENFASDGHLPLSLGIGVSR